MDARCGSSSFRIERTDFGRWSVTAKIVFAAGLSRDASVLEEALENLREALELHFEPPLATRPPKVRQMKVEVGAA